MRASAAGQQQETIAALKLRLAQADDRLGRLTDAYIDRLIEPELFEARKKRSSRSASISRPRLRAGRTENVTSAKNSPNSSNAQMARVWPTRAALSGKSVICWMR